MTPRTKEQNEQIRIRRMAQILKVAADVYLDKGMLMEIRDVAAEAGLGYGTVYHYYKNKADVLHDLLAQAMNRAEEILRLSSPVVAVPADAVGASGTPAFPAGTSGNGGGIAAVSAVATEARVVAAAKTGSGPPQDQDDLRALAVRLLESWGDDHAFYLACQLGGDQFRALPEEQAARLTAAYREQILLPLSRLISVASNGGSGRSGPPGPSEQPGRVRPPGASSHSGTAPVPGPGRQAEWLLAALTGCALSSIRRGTLRSEAGQIVRFLF
ncbi:TetR family transcriptional regulator [Fontibacillus phaseoli]|uniref:TetR family transcriptional regulator n=1 Tax=Fontibacillus phaseoli TaxID=1416533 RepID=A0A369BNW6_9BACL|nr:TetR/AcrR family transcriptional regulator [Fontibacillus phaseoli]RCX23081.1 TetR family transcriptional regulator [Fontibacillus phaseoli]